MRISKIKTGGYAHRQIVKAERDFMTKGEWNPEYELLSIEELGKLPKPNSKGAARPGVYFLFRGSSISHDPDLIYVGRSNNVRSRVASHEVIFDSATYLAIPWPWHKAIEPLYIRAYSPAQNKHFLSKTTFLDWAILDQCLDFS